MPELTGRRRFSHLFRRAAFGISELELNAAVARDANEDRAYDLAVDALLNYEAVPEIADRVPRDTSYWELPVYWWLDRMVRTRRPLLEKMTLFWHDHFATSLAKDGVTIELMCEQNDLLRDNALGNFEQMLREISRDPAMLVWLDLIYNRKSSPNENWARELLELFTFGVGEPGSVRYSELDIRELTRAFTGYTIGPGGGFFLNAAEHDSGSKTLFGQTCNSGDSAIRLLMTHHKSGKYVLHSYICQKLFSHFAYPVAFDSPEVDMLAQVFVNRNSIRDVLGRLFKSDQFQSLRAYRALVKSPVELAVGALRMLGAERFPNNGIMVRLREQGQQLWMPRDVSGWPSGRAWVNSRTILSRANMCAAIVISMGIPTSDYAGGPSVMDLLLGLTSGAQKVDRVVGLLVDADVPSSTRQALISFADGADQGHEQQSLFNLVMALPQFQLN
jgi:uncharacterized protein (DUF1800 family)